MTATHLSQTLFSSLPLVEALQKALDAAGYTHCTPIQEATLPRALNGHDVAGQAQTGTGKTAAFMLATLQRLLISPHAGQPTEPHHPRALIMAPTRELAVQIHKEASQLAQFTGLSLGLAYGGTKIAAQQQVLANGVDILIGTPGRIIDCLRQRWLRLSRIEVIVIDEADRMFDLGFISQIRFVLRRLPPRDQRQGLIFSATLSHRVMELGYEHLNNPEFISTSEATQRVAAKISELVYYTANDEKLPLLVRLLLDQPPSRAIVFVNTKRAAEGVGHALQQAGVACGTLSGDVPQKQRLTLLGRFQDGELPVLVATDVAARGLHIPEVSHVFNFDLPQDAAEYVHRIGRTGRVGQEGAAISFACEEYAYSLPDIEAYIGHKIASAAVPADLERQLATAKPTPRTAHGNRRHRGGGQRPPARRPGRRSGGHAKGGPHGKNR